MDTAQATIDLKDVKKETTETLVKKKALDEAATVASKEVKQIRES